MSGEEIVCAFGGRLGQDIAGITNRRIAARAVRAAVRQRSRCAARQRSGAKVVTHKPD